jgi:alkylhydroperoxidase/carboxymuconolactone decarboxylase family protein YurZ
MDSTAPAAQESYDRFFELAYQAGALDAKTKTLVALAASLGAGCAP